MIYEGLGVKLKAEGGRKDEVRLPPVAPPMFAVALRSQ